MSSYSFPKDIRQWSFSVGMAGRVDDKPVEGVDSPRYGRWWWFWLPSLHWNKGIPWRGECLDVTFQWLCFWVTATRWGGRRA